MISAVVYFVSYFIFSRLEVGRVLRIILVICGCATRRKSGLAFCNDKLVSDTSLLSPLAYEFLRRFVLTKSNVSKRKPPHYSLRTNCSVSIKFPFLIVSVEILLGNASLTYTLIEVGIKELDGALLVHESHAKLPPFVPDVHGPKLDGRDAHTREG